MHVKGSGAPTIKGLTIIEVVVVLLVIAVIAGLAVPHFVDVQAEANRDQVESMAATLNSASALNFAACRSQSADCKKPIDNCMDFAQVKVLYGGLPKDFDIAAKSMGSYPGDTVHCKVIHLSSGQSAEFTGITP